MLEHLKQYLGLEGAQPEALLQELIDSSIKQINRRLDVDSFEQGVYTDKIEGTAKMFLVRQRPVTEILEVNGKAVSTQDYMIMNTRRVIFKDVPQVDDFGVVTIKYKAGFEELPSDLKLLYVMYAAGQYNARNGIGISSYRLGEEQIQYSTEQETEQFKGLFNSYKKVDVIG